MKKRVKIIAGAVLLGVLAVAGLVVLLMPVRVETETVQKADLLDTFTVSATVTPKDSQYVCAPLSGTVSEDRNDLPAFQSAHAENSTG